MREAESYNESLFTTVRVEDFVPANHPLRPIRCSVNDALAKMDAKFSAMYEADIKGGRPEDRRFKRPFSFAMAPRTRQSLALGSLESVFGGGCGLLRVDSAVENRPSRPPFAGYPWSLGRFHRSRKPSDAAGSSNPECRVA